MATSIVDTNILVYRVDERSPHKQALAREFVKRGSLERSLAVPHQALVEFMSAVTRTQRDTRLPLLTVHEAVNEVRELLESCYVLYPSSRHLRTALRGALTHQLSWYDAHLLAFAEDRQIATLWTEDFCHGRLYGNVRTLNPFLPAVQEPILPWPVPVEGPPTVLALNVLH